MEGTLNGRTSCWRFFNAGRVGQGSRLIDSAYRVTVIFQLFLGREGLAQSAYLSKDQIKIESQSGKVLGHSTVGRGPLFVTSSPQALFDCLVDQFFLEVTIV